MKIRLILSVFVVIVAAFLVIASPVSAQVDNGGEDSTYVAPVNGEGSTNVANGAEDAAGTNPDAVTTSAVNGAEDTVFVSPLKSSLTTVEVIDTPVNTSNSSSGGSSSSSNKPNNIIVLSVQGLNCPIITSQLLKVGGSNNSADVTRLQTFLKNVEKLDVDVNGSFDAKTEDAVKTFQIKYKDTILAPWKATKASGVVYITTIKKINELACGSALTMNIDEIAVINAYNNKKITSGNSNNVSTDDDVIGATTETTDTSVAVEVDSVNASSTDGEVNTATASDAPVLKRFWGFVVGLFR